MSQNKKINERGVPLEEFPDTYLSRAKASVETHKTYANAFKEIIGMLKDMSWKDITFIDGPGTDTRVQFPLLPEAIRLKIREIARINPNKAKTDFRRGDYGFAKTFDNSEPAVNNSIYMKVESESNGQRSHFPNEGIPLALRGTNLGYKLYRALLQKFKYLRSNTAGTTEKNYAWQSLVSPKKDKRGQNTEDDVHAIVGPQAVFAMVKDIPDRDKIKYAKAFLNRGEIDKSAITKRNFAIDDELKAILPDDVLAEIDPQRREEAERRRQEAARQERERREREALRTHADRFELYAPFGVNAHDWEVGDYIVVKSYLMDTSYNDLPVRKVVEKNGNEYTAIKISDIAQYEADGTIPSRDARKTRTKEDWVKTKLKRGQFRYMEDPSAGRLVVKGSPGGRTVTPTVTPTTQNPNAEAEQTPTQKRLIKNFMRRDFSLFVKTSDWLAKGTIGRNRQPIIPFLVSKTGTGRTAIYSVMNARTAEVRNNLTKDQFDALEMKKFDLHQLERKSSVREGDWVFVKEHRSAMGFVCIVYRITPAANRQPGLYIWTGDARPQYISQPSILYKMTEATNESMGTNLFRFEDLV